MSTRANIVIRETSSTGTTVHSVNLRADGYPDYVLPLIGEAVSCSWGVAINSLIVENFLDRMVEGTVWASYYYTVIVEDADCTVFVFGGEENPRMFVFDRTSENPDYLLREESIPSAFTI